MSDYCIHDFRIAECGLCSPRENAIDVHSRSAGSPFGRTGAALKQDSVDELCRIVSLPPMSIGVGSSVPSELFDALADRFGVPGGGMPEIGEAIARKAGLNWDDNCDSRSSVSGGGSTVTAVGLERLLEAVRRLERDS